MLQPKSRCSSPGPKAPREPNARRGSNGAAGTVLSLEDPSSPKATAEEIAGFYGGIFFKPPDRHREGSADEAVVPLTLSGRNLPVHPALKLLLRWASFLELLKTPSSADTRSGADTKPVKFQTTAIRGDV